MVGRPHQAEAAEARILFVLCIQKAPKGKPPNRGFYSCCAFKLSKKSTKNLFSPRKEAFSLEVHGRWTGGGREVHGRWAKLDQGFATVLGTREIKLATYRSKTQKLTTVSGNKHILDSFEGQLREEGVRGILLKE